MRLTKKIRNNEIEVEIAKIDEGFTKLGQLEDIEEELGIDLITLFKALKNGVYVKGLGYFRYADFDFEGKVIIYGDIDPICGNEFLSDYGKTWALTKEELEK